VADKFTYSVPDEKAFLHTVRQYLDGEGDKELSALLIGATCDISTNSSFSRRRWDAYQANVTIYVPIKRVKKFTEDLRERLYSAVDTVFPREAGFDVMDVTVAPRLEAPLEEDEPLANTGTLVASGPIEHDGLRFRSRTEVRIYDTLKKRNVLFFANSTAVLGSKGVKREPDFLVCQDGKWGILEVMGDQYHTSATAMRDHDRARLFKDYGLYYIEFYDAVPCYNKPDEVVDDFLARLAKS
jgi:hypothetical protein